jgi:hypothetical protein
MPTVPAITRALPRAPRSPAPLARRPPVLTRPKAGGPTGHQHLAGKSEEHPIMTIIRTVACLNRGDIRRLKWGR